MKENEDQKEKRKEREVLPRREFDKRNQVMSENTGFDAKIRKHNSGSKRRTHNCYKFGYRLLRIYDWNENIYIRLSSLKNQIEEKYK